MPRSIRPRAHWLIASMAALAWPQAVAQDAANGALLYMRLASDTRACVSCHGPDPGQNHNNILRAADNPAALTRVLNTVSAMGFLRSRLSDGDIADLAAFLGTVTRLNDATSALRLWPITLEFGMAPPGESAARQAMRLENPSTTAALPVTAITSSSPALAVTHNCPAVLAAQAGCDIHATLTPQDASLHRAGVRVQTPLQTQLIGASGYGSSGPLGRLRWRGDPASMAFAAGAPGSVQRQALLLDNTGVMPVVLGQSTFVGPQASQFRRESGCDAGTVLQAGTACSMVVAYTASLLPLARATLQVRGDGGNPSSLAVQGAAATSAPDMPSPLAAPPESGGGCTAGPPDRRGGDTSLAWLALAAAALAWLRRPR
jgi:MYXO-CTERM domain-containing protein